MVEAEETHDEWIPLPDAVAVLLGRLTFYAAWLDDKLGDAVVMGNPEATHLAESTPDWAASGARLVAAVRGITAFAPVGDQLADRLAGLNQYRNLLVHGVWLWRRGAVMVVKRSLNSGGERMVEYDTLSYEEIEELVGDYQKLGKYADRFVAALRKYVERPYEDRYRCPNDGTSLEGSLVDDIMVQLCPTCGYTAEATAAL
ncbi:hypothetical protein [Microbacterium sp. NPDC079176]|uniref:hypothetical protein n=1 Tax=Microbacterium sp. NPDC079176 TaxID=3154768 RepID=UPI003426B3B4